MFRNGEDVAKEIRKDMEKEILERDTITAKILKLFKERSEDSITADDILEALHIKYSTAWGIICRLHKMGLIEKEGRGLYFYPKVVDDYFGEVEEPIYEEFEEEIKPTREAIDADIEENLQEFYEDKNERIKIRALQNIRELARLYRIRHHSKIWELINKLPNEIEVKFQSTIVRLIQMMLSYEQKTITKGLEEIDRSKIKLVMKRTIIKEAKTPLIDTILCEEADRNARKIALDILIDYTDKDVIETYLKIMYMGEQSWSILGGVYHQITESIKDSKELRNLFLKEVEKLYREDDEKLFKRGEEIYGLIRESHYKEFFLLD